MNQKTLAALLKAVLAGACICGAVIYFAVIPAWGHQLAYSSPELNKYFLPWLVLSWVTAVPCFWALGCAWKVAVQIGRDNSFSYENAAGIRRIGMLAATDGAIVFAGNVLFAFLNINHPGVFILSVIIVFIGCAVAVACFTLSYLVYKAALMRDEQNLTV
ncbi:MAG: DUF2975 domain-containing protein [Oscillospiraceae bacterium]